MIRNKCYLYCHNEQSCSKILSYALYYPCYFSTHIIITMWEVKNYEHTCKPTFKQINCISKDISYRTETNSNDIYNRIKISFDVLRLCTCKYGWYVFWCHTKLRQITSFTCILTTNFLNINFVSKYIYNSCKIHNCPYYSFVPLIIF